MAEPSSIILKIHAHQLEQRNISSRYRCLFCPWEERTVKEAFLLHLYRRHHVYIGHPDAIVYLPCLLEVLREQLAQVRCLWCQKIFKNHVVLKKHMKEKRHRRVDPAQTDFAAFFVVNYLDGTLPFPNVDLVERCAEVDDGHVPRECGEEQELGGNACTSSSSSSSSCPTASDLAEASSHSTRMREMRNSGDLQGTESELWAAMHEQDGEEEEWGDWEGDEGMCTQCLYCTILLDSPVAMFDHMCIEHSVDIRRWAQRNTVDHYDFVKIVNYVRSRVKTGRCVCCEKQCGGTDSLCSHMQIEQHYGFPTVSQCHYQPSTPLLRNAFAPPSTEAENGNSLEMFPVQSWRDEVYLYPVLPSDGLLLFGYDELYPSSQEQESSM